MQKTAYYVRISDWSSDVCSSDLDLCRAQGHRRDAAPHGPQRGRPLRPAAAHCRRGEAAVQGNHPAVGRQPRRLPDGADADLLPGDRKSVVYGTRVAVRVELGGVSLINTTKNNKKITKHYI